VACEALQVLMVKAFSFVGNKGAPGCLVNAKETQLNWLSKE
jgi:hypothetical protein